MYVWGCLRFLIGVGLSMDAVAVSMTNGMVYQGVSTKKTFGNAALFGLFQALMPLLGFLPAAFSPFYPEVFRHCYFGDLGYDRGEDGKDGFLP